MELANCSTCNSWKAPSFFIRDSSHPQKFNVCANCVGGRKGALTFTNDYCPSHTRRIGEPLGLGLTKWWFLSRSHKFWLAAVQHDMEYDLLLPGASTKQIDKNFLNNCLALSENTWDKIEARIFFCIIRTYGVLR